MGKIGVNKAVASANIKKITNSGQKLSTLQDGLRQPASTINTPTPKALRRKYTQLTELLTSFGGLVINDAERISAVTRHMEEYDSKMGRR
ncbi:TIGR04197 family type VII secretion effector [uncultured Lactobacillus sp.]|uniref:TIGR04197 family type VII secretion effector n=1 Tax=uncultured Lactobacillus sp. TaxID=153152 RepID=UPI00262D391E|nr:TIGR04197 family type VII secretion effector [uncultured Lactobacillus sp.]